MCKLFNSTLTGVPSECNSAQCNASSTLAQIWTDIRTKFQPQPALRVPQGATFTYNASEWHQATKFHFY